MGTVYCLGVGERVSKRMFANIRLPSNGLSICPTRVSFRWHAAHDLSRRRARRGAAAVLWKLSCSPRGSPGAVLVVLGKLGPVWSPYVADVGSTVVVVDVVVVVVVSVVVVVVVVAELLLLLLLLLKYLLKGCPPTFGFWCSQKNNVYLLKENQSENC